PDLVSLIIDTLANAIDPANTQSLVDGLRPSEPSAAGVRLDEPYDYFCACCSILSKPAAEFLGIGEEDGISAHLVVRSNETQDQRPRELEMTFAYAQS